jgi:hypothetical protein
VFICGSKRKRGQALVVAILALTALTAAAIAISAAARLELRAARRGVDEIRREAALRGAVNRGMAALEEGRQDPETLLQTLREHRELQWAPLMAETDPEAAPMQVAIQILDASSLMNLNTATSDQLEKLEMSKEISRAIQSWRDDQDKEDPALPESDRPYAVRNRPFDTLEELLLVPGVTPGFFGAPTVRQTRELELPPLSELLTPFSGENNTDPEGNPRVDLNAATADDLLAAANRYGRILTEQQAAGLVQRRDQATQPIRSVPEVLQAGQIPAHHWGPLLDAWTVDRRTFLPGRVNANTVSPLVLEALGIDQNATQSLLKKRAQRPEGLQWGDLLDVMAPGAGQQGQGQGQDQQQNQAAQQIAGITKLFSVRSAGYLVRCLVRDGASTRTDAVMALVYWPASPEDPAQVIQWRRPDRYPGWTAWYRPPAEDEGTQGG